MLKNLICTNMEPSSFQDLQHSKLKKQTKKRDCNSSSTHLSVAVSVKMILFWSVKVNLFESQTSS